MISPLHFAHFAFNQSQPNPNVSVTLYSHPCTGSECCKHTVKPIGDYSLASSASSKACASMSMLHPKADGVYRLHRMARGYGEGGGQESFLGTTGWNGAGSDLGGVGISRGLHCILTPFLALLVLH